MKRIALLAAAAALLYGSTIQAGTLDDATKTAKNEVFVTRGDGGWRMYDNAAVLDDVTFSWVIDALPNADSSKVLYFLHGNGGNAYSLADTDLYRKTMADYWAAHNIRPPVLIAMSFGRTWFLTDVPSYYVRSSTGQRKNMAVWFPTKVIPFLEQKLAVHVTAGLATHWATTRLIWGSSMGGYNTALLMERNGDLFSKVVTGCPAIWHGVNPFSSEAQIQQYCTDHDLTCKPVTATDPEPDDPVHNGLRLFRRDYDGKTEQDWQRNDPLVLSALITPQSPPLQVWYNFADQYGFDDGAEKFRQNADLTYADPDQPDSLAGTDARVRPALTNGGEHCGMLNIIEGVTAFLTEGPLKDLPPAPAP